MKPCIACRIEKPLSEFYKHSMMADGHLNKCKPCVRQAVRENREKKLDYYQAYDRRRYYAAGHRGNATEEAKKRGQQRWEARNQHKKRAHGAVAKAVRDGRLDKPERCERCGRKPPPRRLHAHHHDYSKPLDVEWVCTRCHGIEHRKPGWEKLLPF